MARQQISVGQARREPDSEVFEVVAAVLKADPQTWALLRGGHKALLCCCDGCCRIVVGGTIRVDHQGLDTCQFHDPK